MNLVLREEKKFLLGVEEFLRLSHTLGQVLAEDPHNGTHGYRIRSLYFDTVHDGDFFEKAAGTEVRRKVRLRTYDPAGTYAMMELKQKEGAHQLKRSLRVTREDAIRISNGEYEALLRYREPFAVECYALMRTRVYRPVTVVEYRRKAFIAKENKIRVTFDHQITATESCFELFSPSLNMNPVMDASAVVLEVKYNGFLLEYIRRLLNPADRSELSVSKYVLARQQACLTRF